MLEDVNTRNLKDLLNMVLGEGKEQQYPYLNAKKTHKNVKTTKRITLYDVA